MRTWRLLAGVGVLLAASLGLSRTPAAAVWAPGPPPVGSTPTGDVTSEVIMTGTGPGGGVDGWIGPPGSISDPSANYPGDPTTLPGFTSHPEGFAGIIHGTPTDGGPTLNLYCIDILTLTYGGVGYNLGTWDASNVDNVGYVAYLLNNYYPNVPAAPTGLADDNQRAAAVQAAIWYFSDNFVLTATDPLRAAVTTIVDDTRTNGPLVQPPPPSLQITPPSTVAPASGLAGPFSVASPGGPATVNATGASMFSDATGTTPVANGATVPDGTRLWLRSAAVGTATLSATASANVPSGNVYLYSGNLSGVTDAQRLILAESTTLTTTVSATAQYVDSGALVVTKAIDGPGAGSQGEIVISVVCGGVALDDFVIPPGTTGTPTKTYSPIFPTPVDCTITETVDGANDSVTVVTVNGSQTVTVPVDEVAANPVEAPPITDTFETTTTTTTAPTTTTTTAPTTTTSTTAPTSPSTDPGTGAAAAGTHLSSTGAHSWWPTAVALGIGAVVVGGLVVLVVGRRRTA